MKTPIILGSLLGIFQMSAIAGTPVPATADGFADARRPMTNPTLFDLALPTTNLHPIFIHHALPNHIGTQAGSLPLGGDVDVYALQFEFALNDRWSIVASKDGYVDMNPDHTLADQEGFANLGAGVKYAFWLDPDSKTAMSAMLGYEAATGNSDVFQGEGDGIVNLTVAGLKLQDAWQFAGAAGLNLPVTDEQATNLWVSTHVSYEVNRWFIPLVELNWFHVLDAGDGSSTAISPLVNFEGGDFFNLGASHAGVNRDFVTSAVGFRSRLTDSVDVGVAYEIPLTERGNSLMESRLTVDLVWKF